MALPANIRSAQAASQTPPRSVEPHKTCYRDPRDPLRVTVLHSASVEPRRTVSPRRGSTPRSPQHHATTRPRYAATTRPVIARHRPFHEASGYRSDAETAHVPAGRAESRAVTQPDPRDDQKRVFPTTQRALPPQCGENAQEKTSSEVFNCFCYRPLLEEEL